MEQSTNLAEELTINENIQSRATSGVIENNFRTGYKVRVSWITNSQNIVNNTSNVTFKAELVATSSGYYISSTSTKNGSLSINGTTYNFTFTSNLTGGQTKILFTKTLDIPHNQDGSKTCNISCVLGLNVTLSGVYWGDVKASGNVTFNAIPRTSTFTLNTKTATMGSTQVVATINRASSSFTHKVYYRFGSIDWLGSSNAATSFSFTPAIDDCLQIPNSTSGVASIVVETWNGNTYIGSETQTLTLKVPTSVKPNFSSITSSVVENGANKSFGYLKGKSKAKLTINGATGSYGSTITKYTITGGGFSSSSSSFTTGALSTSGDITFTGYITDSRGRISESKTVTINVKDYKIPVIDMFNAYRCNSEGVENEEGTYAKVRLEYAHTILEGNTDKNKIEFKKSSDTVWINAGEYTSPRGIIIGNSGLSTSSSYDIKVTVSDQFETVTKIIQIAPSFVTLDIKKGGKGIAVGKSAETDNLFEVAMDFKSNSNRLKLGKGLFGSNDDGISSTEHLVVGSGGGVWLKANNYYDGEDNVYKTNVGASQILVEGNQYPKFRWSNPSLSEYPSWSTWHDMVTTYQPQLDNLTVGTSKNWNSNGWGTSYLCTGNGDNATYDTHNVVFRSHWGIGFRDHTDTTRLVIDTRAGSITNKGTINSDGDIYSKGATYTGSYQDEWSAFCCRRQIDGTNYQGRMSMGSISDVKLTSTSSAVRLPVATVEINNNTTGTTLRRFGIGSSCFIPSSDNSVSLGTSSHRFKSVYVATGVIYSSSKNEKMNIKPLNNDMTKTLALDEESNDKNIIKEGIKNTNLYSYNYKPLKVLNDNNEEIEIDNGKFVGFLGQELEKNNKEFFDLIGSSYKDENGVEQYDIRESSIVGVLWSGLQDSLIENEIQTQEIYELRKEINALKKDLNQIKEILNKIA